MAEKSKFQTIVYNKFYNYVLNRQYRLARLVFPLLRDKDLKSQAKLLLDNIKKR